MRRSNSLLKKTTSPSSISSKSLDANMGQAFSMMQQMQQMQCQTMQLVASLARGEGSRLQLGQGTAPGDVRLQMLGGGNAIADCVPRMPMLGDALGRLPMLGARGADGGRPMLQDAPRVKTKANKAKEDPSDESEDVVQKITEEPSEESEDVAQKATKTKAAKTKAIKKAPTSVDDMVKTISDAMVARQATKPKVTKKRPAASTSIEAATAPPAKKVDAKPNMPKMPTEPTPTHLGGGAIYFSAPTQCFRVYVRKGDRIDKRCAWGSSKETKANAWSKACNWIMNDPRPQS